MDRGRGGKKKGPKASGQPLEAECGASSFCCKPRKLLTSSGNHNVSIQSIMTMSYCASAPKVDGVALPGKHSAAKTDDGLDTCSPAQELVGSSYAPAEVENEVNMPMTSTASGTISVQDDLLRKVMIEAAPPIESSADASVTTQQSLSISLRVTGFFSLPLEL